ncbi:putative flagellar C1a complex subunit [Histomonas meleagridis]|uniref:putative flagellar C1a complex subunit n=1 Tax=Histomonas meleagridis TaxID=135588 RepID=UPI00355A1208|nr:putative flagellar C1a complex subunit [Histomonas meleagridis]KAH0797936.1 putative flagellar C1a complex subunit [Histomonas meleagridis]
MFIEATSSPFYNPQSLHEQYEKLLLSHSVDRPPTSTLIFELRDIRLINEFFVNTFFRHLKLILNCFTPKQILVFKTQFPIRVTYPQLPPLSSMTLIRNENEISREETNSQQSQRTLNTETINEPPKTPQKEVTKENEKEKEKQKEEKSQEIPLQMLMGSFKAMHEKFISDFEEREKQLAGKIKELEMKLNEKQKLKSTQSKKNKL